MVPPLALPGLRDVPVDFPRPSPRLSERLTRRSPRPRAPPIRRAAMLRVLGPEGEGGRTTAVPAEEARHRTARAVLESADIRRHSAADGGDSFLSPLSLRRHICERFESTRRAVVIWSHDSSAADFLIRIPTKTNCGFSYSLFSQVLNKQLYFLNSGP